MKIRSNLLHPYCNSNRLAMLGCETEGHCTIILLILKAKCEKKFHTKFEPQTTVTDFKTSTCSRQLKGIYMPTVKRFASLLHLGH